MGDTDMMVTTDNGKLTLTIPDTALPAGVSREDISLTTQPWRGQGHLGSYQLEPDGLVFNEPIAFTVEIPQYDQSSSRVRSIDLPTLVLHSKTEDGFSHEVLQDTELELVPDGDETRLLAKGELQHFSSLSIHSYLRGTITDPGPQIIDVPFPVRVIISQQQDTIYEPIIDQPWLNHFVTKLNSWWLFSANYASDIPFILRPDPASVSQMEQISFMQAISNSTLVVSPTAWPGGIQMFSDQAVFTCVAEMRGELWTNIHYVTNILFELEFLIEDDQGNMLSSQEPEQYDSRMTLHGNDFPCVYYEEKDVGKKGKTGSEGEEPPEDEEHEKDLDNEDLAKDDADEAEDTEDVSEGEEDENEAEEDGWEESVFTALGAFKATVHAPSDTFVLWESFTITAEVIDQTGVSFEWLEDEEFSYPEAFRTDRQVYASFSSFPETILDPSIVDLSDAMRGEFAQSVSEKVTFTCREPGEVVIGFDYIVDKETLEDVAWSAYANLPRTILDTVSVVVNCVEVTEIEEEDDEDLRVGNDGIPAGFQKVGDGGITIDEGWNSTFDPFEKQE